MVDRCSLLSEPFGIWHVGYFNGSEVGITSAVQVDKSKSDMTLSLTRGGVWKFWTTV